MVKATKKEFTQSVNSFLLKAAPRFELGVRVLQTPALPLGHAARRATNIAN